MIFENLLQIGAAFVITNWGNSYYQLGQLILLQIGARLLKIGSSITNWDLIYYKSGQVLQSLQNN